jgi:hypothetical protein
MMLLSQKDKIKTLTTDLETKILIEGGKLGMENRTFGHVLYTTKLFNTKIIYTTNNKLALTSAESTNDGIVQIVNNLINIEWIIEALKRGPLIIGVGNYTYNKDFHFPHFIIIEKNIDSNFQVIEPWQGKRLTVSRDILNRSMEGLEETLLYWKEAIQIV